MSKNEKIREIILPLDSIYETSHSYFIIHETPKDENFLTINQYSESLLKKSQKIKNLEIFCIIKKIIKIEILLNKYNFFNKKFNASAYILENPGSLEGKLKLHDAGSIEKTSETEEKRKNNTRFLRSLIDYFSFILNPEVEETKRESNDERLVIPDALNLHMRLNKSSLGGNTSHTNGFNCTDNLSKSAKFEEVEENNFLVRFGNLPLSEFYSKLEEEFDRIMLDYEVENETTIKEILSFDSEKNINISKKSKKQKEIGFFGPKMTMSFLSDKPSFSKTNKDTDSEDLIEEIDPKFEKSVFEKMESFHEKYRKNKNLMMDVKIRNDEAILSFRA